MEQAEEDQQQHAGAGHHELEQAQHELLDRYIIAELQDLVLAEYLEEQERHVDGHSEVEEVQYHPADVAARRQGVGIAVDERWGQQEVGEPDKLSEVVLHIHLGHLDVLGIYRSCLRRLQRKDLELVFSCEQHLVPQVAVHFHGHADALTQADHC